MQRMTITLVVFCVWSIIVEWVFRDGKAAPIKVSELCEENAPLLEKIEEGYGSIV